MSGQVFVTSETVDAKTWNPLLCTLCNEQYEDPRHLNCYHSFCAKCLRGRVQDDHLSCPLCGLHSLIKESSGLPRSDELLRFLVESSSEERAQCANCDKDSGQMYFCNTCCQPLCSGCREETHKAKMFAKHDIVGLTKRTKDVHKECSIQSTKNGSVEPLTNTASDFTVDCSFTDSDSVHNEPYILFSTEKKTMLCINCFRDMKNESRFHCMDLETAYGQSCKKVDHGMQAIRDLQNSVRSAILLLRILLQEIKANAEKEKAAIISLYDLIQEKIMEKKEALLQQAENQFEEKENLFRDQLLGLSTLLPTLHTHLVTCAAFCSSANKFEFLAMAYVLMARLKSVIQVKHPLHPNQGSQINTDHKNQFAKCLEPALFPLRSSAGVTAPSSLALTCTNNTPVTRLDRFELPGSVAKAKSEHATPGQIEYTLARNGGRRYNGHNVNRVKFIDAKGVFADHCKEFEAAHRELMQNVEKKKNAVQETQRDLTLRRCLSKGTVFADTMKSIDELEQCLLDHLTLLEQKHPLLEKHWEESLQRIGNEQEVYQAQLNDVIRLEQETKQLKTIQQQLSSFVRSITAVSERLAPRLGESCNHDTQMQSLLEQINTMQPDSKQRVDAIRTAQEERTLTASWANPLDEELIKTKGLLRAPSARSNIKRSSQELKDVNLNEEHTVSEQNETIKSNLSDEHNTSVQIWINQEIERSEGIGVTDSEISEERKTLTLDSEMDDGNSPLNIDTPVTFPAEFTLDSALLNNCSRNGKALSIHDCVQPNLLVHNERDDIKNSQNSKALENDERENIQNSPESKLLVDIEQENIPNSAESKLLVDAEQENIQNSPESKLLVDNEKENIQICKVSKLLVDDEREDIQNSPESKLLVDIEQENIPNSAESKLLVDAEQENTQNSPESKLLVDNEKENIQICKVSKLLVDDEREDIQNSPESKLLVDIEQENIPNSAESKLLVDAEQENTQNSPESKLLVEYEKENIQICKVSKLLVDDEREDIQNSPESKLLVDIEQENIPNSAESKLLVDAEQENIQNSPESKLLVDNKKENIQICKVSKLLVDDEQDDIQNSPESKLLVDIEQENIPNSAESKLLVDAEQENTQNSPESKLLVDNEKENIQICKVSKLLVDDEREDIQNSPESKLLVDIEQENIPNSAESKLLVDAEQENTQNSPESKLLVDNEQENIQICKVSRLLVDDDHENIPNSSESKLLVDNEQENITNSPDSKLLLGYEQENIQDFQDSKLLCDNGETVQDSPKLKLAFDNGQDFRLSVDSRTPVYNGLDLWNKSITPFTANHADIESRDTVPTCQDVDLSGSSVDRQKVEIDNHFCTTTEYTVEDVAVGDGSNNMNTPNSPEKVDSHTASCSSKNLENFNVSVSKVDSTSDLVDANSLEDTKVYEPHVPTVSLSSECSGEMNVIDTKMQDNTLENCDSGPPHANNDIDEIVMEKNDIENCGEKIYKDASISSSISKSRASRKKLKQKN